MLYALRKPEYAILQLNRIIKASPENSEALGLKAYALDKLANEREEWAYSQRALEFAEKALTLNTDDEMALTAKGWALIGLGKAQEALAPLQRDTKIYPHNEFAWYNLAWAQYLIGDSEASKSSIQQALKISPGNAVIQKGKLMMERGETPEHLRKKRSSSRRGGQ